MFFVVVVTDGKKNEISRTVYNDDISLLIPA